MEGGGVRVPKKKRVWRLTLKGWRAQERWGEQTDRWDTVLRKREQGFLTDSREHVRKKGNIYGSTSYTLPTVKCYHHYPEQEFVIVKEKRAGLDGF